jgi:DNA modification methylase
MSNLDVEVEVEEVNLAKVRRPDDYHCSCKWCRKFLGVLRKKDGTFYSRNERRAYYSKEEIASTKDEGGGHLAKTPLHIARWAVQTYTKTGNVVFDPTMGAGTTAVESLRLGRATFGIELEFVDVILANIKINNPFQMNCKIVRGDALDMTKILSKNLDWTPFDLIVNNPPYFGDQSQKGMGQSGYTYTPNVKNIALSKGDYYSKIESLYRQSSDHLRSGGHLVIGVKDQMKNKKPDMLHEKINNVISDTCGLVYVGTAILPHHPKTLFLNSYPKQYPGVVIPLYQTIAVWRKP